MNSGQKVNKEIEMLRLQRNEAIAMYWAGKSEYEQQERTRCCERDIKNLDYVIRAALEISSMCEFCKDKGCIGECYE
jgi:hypothetical protein